MSSVRSMHEDQTAEEPKTEQEGTELGTSGQEADNRPITTENGFDVDAIEEMSVVAVVIGREGKREPRVISVHRTMRGAEQQAETARARYDSVVITAAVLAD